MRTLWGPFAALSLIVASAMFVGSGYLAHVNVGGDMPLSSAADRVDKQASGSVVETGLQTSRKTEGDDNFLGLVLSFLGDAIKLAKLILVFPAGLRWLGFPAWFATPAGSVLQLLTGLGVGQVAANRYWK